MRMNADILTRLQFSLGGRGSCSNLIFVCSHLVSVDLSDRLLRVSEEHVSPATLGSTSPSFTRPHTERNLSPTAHNKHLQLANCVYQCSQLLTMDGVS
jgi:hypothetical protein